MKAQSFHEAYINTIFRIVWNCNGNNGVWWQQFIQYKLSSCKMHGKNHPVVTLGRSFYDIWSDLYWFFYPSSVLYLEGGVFSERSLLFFKSLLCGDYSLSCCFWVSWASMLQGALVLAPSPASQHVLHSRIECFCLCLIFLFAVCLFVQAKFYLYDMHEQTSPPLTQLEISFTSSSALLPLHGVEIKLIPILTHCNIGRSREPRKAENVLAITEPEKYSFF